MDRQEDASADGELRCGRPSTTGKGPQQVQPDEHLGGYERSNMDLAGFGFPLSLIVACGGDGRVIPAPVLVTGSTAPADRDAQRED